MTDKYNMNIPGDIADFILNYINNNPELGFRFVSQYIVHLLRENIKEISSQTKKKERKIILPSGTYTKEEVEKLFKES